MIAPILVTGGGGMLAYAIRKVFGDEVELVTKAELDITDSAAVATAVQGRIAVINTAAFTAVDEAERDEERAWAINAGGAENIATACSNEGARMIQLSTDYVFDGRATDPYAEDAPGNPQSAYGRSKQAGEDAVRNASPSGATIVRTAWLYGAGGHSFVATMLAKARAGETVNVVMDQVGQPTWTMDVAERIRHLLAAPPGIYHATNAGSCSWWDLAVALYESVGAPTTLVSQTTSDAFQRPAPRPAYSVLADGAAASQGIPAMRSWRDALAEALKVDFAV